MREAPGSFWLTGSQVFKLMRGIQESLAGRVAVLSMTSLSQAEIGRGVVEPFKGNIQTLSDREKQREAADAGDIFERIYRGSMTTLVSGAYSSNPIFYGSYLSTYIERDVKILSDAIDSPNSGGIGNHFLSAPLL